MTLLPHRIREHAQGKELAVGESVRIRIGNEDLELPVSVGTEGERGIDIGNLRAKTGMVTLDPAYIMRFWLISKS